jgi:hypothetical protein
MHLYLRYRSGVYTLEEYQDLKLRYHQPKSNPRRDQIALYREDEVLTVSSNSVVTS